MKEFWALLAAGAVLAPGAKRSEAAWVGKKRKGQVFSRDRAAGDDQYVFLSPNRPYVADELSRPAVAYDLKALMQEREVYFRAHDLEPMYRVVAAQGSEDYDPGEGEELEEDFDPQAANVSQDLWEVAEAATVRDQRKVLILTAAHQKDSWEGLRRQGTIDSVAYRVAKRLIPEKFKQIEAATRDLDDDFWKPADLGIQEILWASEFPELLYPGFLTLRCAAFYRDVSMSPGVWRQMPDRAAQVSGGLSGLGYGPRIPGGKVR